MRARMLSVFGWFPATVLLVWACSESITPGSLGALCPDDRNCDRGLGLRCIDGVCAPGDFPDAGPAPVDGGQPAPVDAGVIDQLPPAQDVVFAGPVQTTPDGTGFGLTVAGNAIMVKNNDGYSSLRLEASGLSPDTQYNAHLHNGNCADGTSPHYKKDPTVQEVIQANELWPSFTTNADGRGVGTLYEDHVIRDEAGSIVIHQPETNERIACANLAPNGDVTLTGTLNALPAGEASGIEGTIELRRYSGGTQVTVNVTGTFSAETIYPVHLHASPCSENDGGPHYKIDNGVQDTVEANEIWPDIFTDTAGAAGTGTATNDQHIVRSDAYSIVVHNPDTGDRMACGTFYYAP